MTPGHGICQLRTQRTSKTAKLAHLARCAPQHDRTTGTPCALNQDGAQARRYSGSTWK